MHGTLRCQGIYLSGRVMYHPVRAYCGVADKSSIRCDTQSVTYFSDKGQVMGLAPRSDDKHVIPPRACMSIFLMSNKQ